MRIRFEIYKEGLGTGAVAECDLTEKQAKARFNQLKENAKCGWIELVAEDADEGGYMNVIDSHEKIRLAQIMSQLC